MVPASFAGRLLHLETQPVGHTSKRITSNGWQEAVKTAFRTLWRSAQTVTGRCTSSTTQRTVNFSGYVLKKERSRQAS